MLIMSGEQLCAFLTIFLVLASEVVTVLGKVDQRSKGFLRGSANQESSFVQISDAAYDRTLNSAQNRILPRGRSTAIWEWPKEDLKTTLRNSYKNFAYMISHDGLSVMVDRAFTLYPNQYGKITLSVTAVAGRNVSGNKKWPFDVFVIFEVVDGTLAETNSSGDVVRKIDTDNKISFATTPQIFEGFRKSATVSQQLRTT
ncbi:unnamed protein product [Amoebophrya sp. A25]|nr:unnamed protein product [Amoebophrya sp. A25]|eukprot:GSA25T00023187001.1